MGDIVVTVPMNFTLPEFPGLRGLDTWCAEGDPAGEPASGARWVFTTGGARPNIKLGDRVYIVCEDRLRGYAPLVNLYYIDGAIGLVRQGGAVAVTIPEKIKGFRGWRYRWWDKSMEVPFPDWRTANRRNKTSAKKVADPQGTLF